MIEVRTNTEGSTYITKGTVRLYIHHDSPRRSLPCFRQLMEMSDFDSYGATEFSECQWSRVLFVELKRVIDDLYYGHTRGNGPIGVYDSVNVVVWDSISQTQDIARGSVLA